MSHRFLLVFALLAWPAFPVAKEILQLQRDIGLLQDQLRTVQRSVDERFAVMQQLLNQNLEAASRLNTSLVVLEKAVQGQEKVLAAPVANVSARVDTLASQFQALREAVEEGNARLTKLQVQLVDIKNIVTTLPAPAPAQAATAQVSADSLYKNAYRDYQAGNFNLAGPQFAEYLKLFGQSELAADAQYYIGEIFYQQAQYEQAEAAFDKVLERYPEGSRSADAQYKKGMSLLKQGRREAAIREFRDVSRKYPRTPAASLAAESLRGLSGAQRPSTAKSSRR